VDEFNKLVKEDSIYVVGDQCVQKEEKFPNGHPQVAQVAIQQAVNLVKNLQNELKNKPWKPFKYNNLGSMATIGKKMAVVDLPFVSFQGSFAWLVWLFVHLMAILGVKNKLMVFLTWSWKYLSFDPSLRLLIRPRYGKDFKRQWMLEEKDYEELIKNPKVMAVGECGLDYYRLDEKTCPVVNNSDYSTTGVKAKQKADFIKQIEFAIKYDKPLMLHIRDNKIKEEAFTDAYEILEKYK
jgi:hypothetical protein